MNLKSYLEINVSDDDIDMIFDIKGSNTVFSGEMWGYGDRKALEHFTDSLTDFPQNNTIPFFEFGHKDSTLSYFSMKLYPASSLSQIGIQIIMATDATFRPETQCKIQFEIIAEPHAVDEFQKALRQIVRKKSVVAILYGNDNRL